MKISITDAISIDERELDFAFVPSTGPGGQHANRAATAVQLRFDVESASLPRAVQQRLKQIAGRRLTEEGVLIIEASRFRSQERNRQDALRRLKKMIHRAAKPTRKRRRTKPPRWAKERRLERKRRRSQKKRFRRRVRPPED